MSGVALGAAAITAGAGIYSASKSGGGGGSAPKPKDPLVYAEKAAKNLFNYYPYAVPLALGVSEKFGPQIMAQMFDQTGQFLGGVGGQPGFQELQRTTGLQAGQTLAELRAAELGQQAGQTGFARNLLASLSPEQAAAVQASAQEAERARVAAQGVTPEEQRMYQQTAREAAQASGRLGGNAAIASEIMGRENVMAAKRAEAAQAGQRSYSQAGEFYTNPGLAALRSAPLSYTAGQQDLSTALSLGPASSGQFDFNAPLGFAQQRAGAENTYAQAKYATDMYNRQANAQMWQGIGSNVAGIVGSGNFGSMLGSGLSSAGNMFGSSGMYNTGAQLYNANLGAGTPPKAYIV
jgi:hypothetical protein